MGYRAGASERGTERRARGGALRRFRRARDGVASIEFAILAMPFFLLVFAIIETCVTFAAEQLVTHGVDTLARKLRTGEITYNMGMESDMTAAEFRQALCDEVALLIDCAEDGDRLYIDLRSLPSFAAAPYGIPREGGQPFGDLDTSGFGFSPGGPCSRNMLRVFYKWEVITDLMRPRITNIREGGEAPTDYLIAATAAFRNECYPGTTGS